MILLFIIVVFNWMQCETFNERVSGAKHIRISVQDRSSRVRRIVRVLKCMPFLLRVDLAYLLKVVIWLTFAIQYFPFTYINLKEIFTVLQTQSAQHEAAEGSTYDQYPYQKQFRYTIVFYICIIVWRYDYGTFVRVCPCVFD